MRKTLPILLCLLTACQQGADAPFRPDAIALGAIEKHKGDVPALVQGNSEFALALYQQLAPEEGNLFFSPYSISTALAMTSAGARGNTAEEMKTALRWTLADDRLHPAFGNLTVQLQGAGKRPYELAIANRLWGQKDYGFLPDFLKIGKDYYHAGLAEVDFQNDTEGARKLINAWVERRTNSKIKDLLADGVLSPDTRLVLTNAIYFKAKWKDPFDEAKTRPDSFHPAAGQTIRAPMMHANVEAGYAEADSLALVELMYVGDDLSMVVLLPKEKDGLGDLEKKLTFANLSAWLAKLSGNSVDLKLPKFKITAAFSLKDKLQQLGMVDAFKPEKADFSGMSSRDRLFISAVVHKAFVEVNEKSTEAAAATGVVMGAASAPPQRPVSFHADHPFIFLIRDRRSGSILFLGRVRNPVS